MKRVMALAVLVFLLGTMASTASPAPSADMNKALVRRYVALVLNGHRLDMLDGLVSSNYKRYVSPIAAPLDLQGQKQRLAGFFAAFPDLRCTIEDLIAEGDRIAYRLKCPGTHQGTFLGIPPTGKQIVAQVSESARVESGKLIEHWGGPDLLNVLQQLGAVVHLAPGGGP